MKKNGFTLIELVTTIGLMVLMGLIIVNNINAIFSNQEDVELDDFKRIVEDAACTYIDLSDPEIVQKKNECKVSGCTVTTHMLISNGLLDDDLVNPWTNKPITGSEVIEISYPNYEKTCTYRE